MDTTASGYAYIATSEGLTNSYVGTSVSLLDMEWIAKFGVNDLVWFEGYPDMVVARTRADQLWAMSEDERRRFILTGNPTQADLTPRIWGSEEEEP